MVKESRKPAQPQDIRSVKGKTPENFIKQLPIDGKGTTRLSKNFDTNKNVKVGGGSVR